MIEPIYTYVRGQGWVILDDSVKCINGKTYRVEKRKPNPGEMCCYSFDKWNLVKWKWWIANSSPYTYDTLKSSLDRSGLDWCTFIEVT